MNTQPSLTGRALLAVALMIGFYVLAIAMALALFWIPYAVVVYAHRISLKLTIGAVVMGFLILWSILPRRDKFVPPGPRLDAARPPRLFEELRSVAYATGQAMPGDVYLVNDV